MATIAELAKIKEGLPAQYAKQISEICTAAGDGIGSDQVRRVFTGDVTNPNIVGPVFDAAIVLLDKQTANNKKLAALLKKTAVV